MKLFTNKKIMQKMTIVMVILMLFNFIMPNYSKAGWIDDLMENIGDILLTGISKLLLIIGDTCIELLDNIFINSSSFGDSIDDENKTYEIAISPGKIFSGVIYALDANFIENKNISSQGIFNSNDPSDPKNAPAYVLHDVIATWYKIMRNIAIVFLLSILVYVGIRILLSTTAADSSKYKEMLKNWVVAICILFALHYIMSFTLNFTQLVTDAFSGQNVSIDSPDVLINTVREEAYDDGDYNIGFIILYIVLIVYTVMYIWYYVKRLVYIAFLTLIAPLVSITYPIDKMGDSKAQAFEMWLREYLLNVIIQPVHLIIYTVMVSSAISLATTNPIYAIVVIGAMVPAENFIKEMFGLNSNKGPKGGFLAGAATMSAINALGKASAPKFGHNSDSKDNSSSKNDETNKKPRTVDEQKSSELSNSITDKDSDIKTSNNSTENRPEIDNGPYETNRTTDDISQDEDLPDPNNIKLADLDEESNSNAVWDTGDENSDDLGQDEDLTDSNDIKLANLDEESDLNAESDTDDNKKLNETSNNEKEDKKKNIRGAAAWNTTKHYGRKIFNGKNFKKLARKSVKLGLGAVGAGTAATLGLAIGVASGDIGNALKYTTAGAMAGAKFGSMVGDTAGNLVGATVDLGKDISSTYKSEKAELTKYDKDAQREQMKKENKKYAHSSEVRRAIKKRFGYNEFSDKDKINEMRDVVERYKNNDVNDLDTIFNCYNMEQGKDAYGNDIGEKLEQNHAMYIGQMAEQMDPNNESSRKSIGNKMQMQFTQNLEEGKNMDRETALEHAKALKKQQLEYIDMAQGRTKDEAKSRTKQDEISKANDDKKEEKAARMQAKFNAEAQQNN